MTNSKFQMKSKINNIKLRLKAFELELTFVIRVLDLGAIC